MNSPPQIPEQLWQTNKTADLPPDLTWYQASVRRHHPDWRYQLLNDLGLRAVVAQHQPALLAIFDAYQTPICRVDLARYVLMWAKGGVYLDLDFECLRPLAPLLYSHTLLIGLEPDSHVALPAVRQRGFTQLLSPALLASRAGHPFWLAVFALIVEAQHAPDPLDATGPFLLTRALGRYRNSEKIALAPAKLLHPLDKFECQHGQAFALESWFAKTRVAYGVHHWAGSWWQTPTARAALGSAELRVFNAGQLTDKMTHTLVRPEPIVVAAAMPLVSALMVTTRRPLMALAAIACFQAQDYPNCELVVVEDDPDPQLGIAIQALNDVRIRFIKLNPGQLNLGELRNHAVHAARGEWVCQWDDDDLYDPARISVQMAALQSQQADACFLSRWTIWWPQQKRFATSVSRLWEGSMLARKSALNAYPSLRRGEDTSVAEAVFQSARVVSLDAPRLYLYVVHGANTFDAAHFDAHWHNASARYSGLDARRVQQELAKRLDLERYLTALEVPTLQVSLFAPFSPGSGIATAAAGTLAALRAADLSVQAIELYPHEFSAALSQTGDSASGSAQAMLVHANPDMVGKIYAASLRLQAALSAVDAAENGENTTLSSRLDAKSFAVRTCVGLWAWESPNTFRQAHLPAFSLFDEIWAPSAFARAAIARVSPIPVLCMPHAMPISARQADRAAFGLHDGDFIFLCLFDALSQLLRKNPQAVIAAFKAAFPLTLPERVKLVIKTKNLKQESRQILQASIALHPAISLLEQHFDTAQLQTLIASSDVLVSLHRAEGFGLVLAEAMAMGVPVMASAWSGNLEFMSADNSVLIDTQPYVLAADEGYFSAGTAWREANIAHASERMRWLYNHPEAARQIGLAGQAHIAKHLSPAHIGAQMRARLQAQRHEQPRPMRRPTSASEARAPQLREWPMIMIATPICNAAQFLPRYVELLERLEYPQERLRLVLFAGESRDQTHAILQQLRPRIADIFSAVEVLFAPADTKSWQQSDRAGLAESSFSVNRNYQTHAALAHARNQCLRQLSDQDDWVFWLDADVSDYPSSILTQLLALAAPVACANASDAAQSSDGIKGSGLLLVRADIHRHGINSQGIEFADFSYKGFMDCSAFKLQAREAGFKVASLILSEP